MLTVLTVITSLAASSARADDKDLLVGTWEMNTTMNGYVERGVMTLRANGTGRHDRYAAGQEDMHCNFTWKLTNGGIRFIYAPRETKYARFRFDATNSITVTPADSRFNTIGPNLEYARQFTQRGPRDATSRSQVIGVWEAVGNNGFGQACHIEMVLRVYGTGQRTLRCGDRMEVAYFDWNFIDGAVIGSFQNGMVGKAQIRFLENTNMEFVPVNFYGIRNGPVLYYQKIAENDEGC